MWDERCASHKAFSQIAALSNIAGAISESNNPQTFIEGNRCPYNSIDPGNFRTDTPFCEIHFAERSLMSMSCTSSTLPGAYPFMETHPVTFDLINGKIYEVSDLFQPNSNWPVRIAVSMRDTWWEDSPGDAISFPYKMLEAGEDFPFYLQAKCDEAFPSSGVGELASHMSASPKVCIAIPNLGSGAARNYIMIVRMDALKEILDTSGPLKTLDEYINDPPI